MLKNNGLGDRASKTVGAVETLYTLDATGLPHVIVETTGGQTTAYLPGLAQDQGMAWAYQLPDALGSIRHLANASAQVTLARSYEPFGGLLAQAGTGSSGFGFAGEQRDASTGLVFLRARYYEPALGRFVNKDPWPGTVSRPATLHGYQYVANNPILHSDPSGKDYVLEVDRYTCDDPYASGGYVFHYDQATGAWGPWPCIVNPANLTLNNNPYKYSNKAPIPVGAPGYPYPDRNGGPPGGETKTQPLPLSPHIYRSTLPFDGYLEGTVKTVVAFGCQIYIEGNEVVYDFYTRERGNFRYTGTAEFGAFENWLLQLNNGTALGPTGVDSSLFGVSHMSYFGILWGFGEAGIEEQYEGPFWSGGISLATSLGFTSLADKLGGGKLTKELADRLGMSESVTLFSGVDKEGLPTFELWGASVSLGGESLGDSPLKFSLPLNISVGWTTYKMDTRKLYGTTEDDYASMIQDILKGVNSPLSNPPILQGFNARELIVDAILAAD